MANHENRASTSNHIYADSFSSAGTYPIPCLRSTDPRPRPPGHNLITSAPQNSIMPSSSHVKIPTSDILGTFTQLAEQNAELKARVVHVERVRHEERQKWDVEILRLRTILQNNGLSWDPLKHGEHTSGMNKDERREFEQLRAEKAAREIEELKKKIKAMRMSQESKRKNWETAKKDYHERKAEFVAEIHSLKSEIIDKERAHLEEKQKWDSERINLASLVEEADARKAEAETALEEERKVLEKEIIREMVEKEYLASTLRVIREGVADDAEQKEKRRRFFEMQAQTNSELEQWRARMQFGEPSSVADS